MLLDFAHGTSGEKVWETGESYLKGRGLDAWTVSRCPGSSLALATIGDRTNEWDISHQNLFFNWLLIIVWHLSDVLHVEIHSQSCFQYGSWIWGILKQDYSNTFFFAIFDFFKLLCIAFIKWRMIATWKARLMTQAEDYVSTFRVMVNTDSSLSMSILISHLKCKVMNLCFQLGKH